LQQFLLGLVSGIESMEVLKQNIGIAGSFRLLEGDELNALLAKVKPLAGDGRQERFKSSQFCVRAFIIGSNTA
jgi:uncharacterized protein